MEHWVRFDYLGSEKFGILKNDYIAVYEGDMFQDPAPTGGVVPLSDVQILIPSNPAKLIGLWNNFHSRAKQEGWTKPTHPLYFVKANSSYLANGGQIRQPSSYSGQVVYEGELGVVIGKQCHEISEEQAERHIFGYTCVNDVTARGLMREDPSFVQWTRAKSFDTFGVFGPAIATGLDASSLVVKTLVDDVEMQNYPVDDMFFMPNQIVSRLSHDMTLNPGDIIACGTSLGAGPLSPGCTVEVRIDGIGSLVNPFQ